MLFVKMLIIFIRAIVWSNVRKGPLLIMRPVFVLLVAMGKCGMALNVLLIVMGADIIMSRLGLVNAIKGKFGLDNIVLFVRMDRILTLLWGNVNVILVPTGMESLVYHAMATQYGMF